MEMFTRKYGTGFISKASCKGTIIPVAEYHLVVVANCLSRQLGVKRAYLAEPTNDLFKLPPARVFAQLWFNYLYNTTLKPITIFMAIKELTLNY